MGAHQFSIRDVLVIVSWVALGLAATLWARAILPDRPSLDLAAKILDILAPLTAGAAFGAAAGRLIRREFARALGGIAAAVLLFFSCS